MDSLRAALQPITHNLPAPIQDLGVSILGQSCYKTLLHDIDISSPACLKLAISKGLGIGIIGASSIVKVPQILKLINSRSASGISFLSYLLETAAYLIGLAYNVRQEFPFSTYGETGLIMVQNVVIAVLVLHYSGKQSAAGLFVAALATGAFTLFSENLVDMITLGYLQAGAGALGVAAKLPQILAVWQEGGTGQLSAFAVSGRLSGTIFLNLRNVAKKIIVGFQLPPRLPLPHLHDSARGRRQINPVWLRRRLRAECSPRNPDGVLLERAYEQVNAEGDGSCCG